MTRAVLWDFDGTLATRAGGWSACLVEALRSVAPSVACDREAVRPGLRSGFPWHTPDVGHGPHAPDAWWEALAPLLSRAYAGAGVPPEHAERAVAAFRAVYTTPSAWTVYDDVGPAFALLGAYRHVIVSNHVPELPDLVAALGLRVDAVVTSATVGWEKPNPRLFEAALAVARAPDEVWMVGDNPVADVAGAEALGIPAILVRTEGPAAWRCPDLVSAARVILGAPN